MLCQDGLFLGKISTILTIEFLIKAINWLLDQYYRHPALFCHWSLADLCTVKKHNIKHKTFINNMFHDFDQTIWSNYNWSKGIRYQPFHSKETGQFKDSVHSDA